MKHLSFTEPSCQAVNLPWHCGDNEHRNILDSENVRFLVLSEENKDFYKQRPRCLGAIQDKFTVSCEVQALCSNFGSSFRLCRRPRSGWVTAWLHAMMYGFLSLYFEFHSPSLSRGSPNCANSCTPYPKPPYRTVQCALPCGAVAIESNRSEETTTDRLLLNTI